MLVAVDAPAGLAWGSSLPGALLPLEWATPRAVTAARSLPVEWGETFRGSATPVEWGAADRGAATGLPLETSVHIQPAEFSAPAELASRQTATADTAVPAEWRGQIRRRAPLPGAARRGVAAAIGTPAEATGSTVVAADRLLPIAMLTAARATITAPLSAELSGRISPALVQQIEALQSRDFGITACVAALLAAGRRDAGLLAESLAGERNRSITGPEFLAAMLLDPRFAGESAAQLGLAVRLRSEMLGGARNRAAVAVRALLRIEWRQRKRMRIRRLLASSGRRRVLGPANPESGR